jgi:hypothetical protein
MRSHPRSLHVDTVAREYLRFRWACRRTESSILFQSDEDQNVVGVNVQVPTHRVEGEDVIIFGAQEVISRASRKLTGASHISDSVNEHRSQEVFLRRSQLRLLVVVERGEDCCVLVFSSHILLFRMPPLYHPDRSRCIFLRCKEYYRLQKTMLEGTAPADDNNLAIFLEKRGKTHL